MLDYAAMSDTELKKQYNVIDKKIIFNHTLQLALKTLGNSNFGAFAQEGFLFFDTRLAAAITDSGRFIIQYVGRHVNMRLNELMKTKDVCYTIYSDTDSVRGDSLVWVNGEKIPISDLYNRFDSYTYKDDFNKNYVKPAIDVYTKSFNKQTEMVEDKKIKYVMKHSVKKEMFEVTLPNGTSVIVTEDHSVIVYRNRRYIDVSPKEILDTDLVVMLNNT